MKILHWGTGDKGKPRNRIILAALNDAGVKVQEIHHDVWRGVEDKSQLSVRRRGLRYARWIAAYPGLLLRFLIAPRPDAILLGYPAQIDVLVVWPFAKLRGVPVLMDMFISIYDTTICDRGLAQPNSVKARLLWSLEWLGCRAADRVIIDTSAHARYIEQLFRLPQGSVGAVPVGAEAEQFASQQPAVARDRPLVLFYGQLIPLHGVETVLDAALSIRGKAFDWVIIGSGQDSVKVASMLGKSPPSHVRWIKWVPYEELREWIGSANVCLGIFGGSRKAASVVPNKLYQALLAGRHVVTRHSPAIEELLAAGGQGVTLVDAQSCEALLDGIERAARQGFLPPSSELLNQFSATTIGQRLIANLSAIIDPPGRVGEKG